LASLRSPDPRRHLVCKYRNSKVDLLKFKDVISAMILRAEPPR
jgi:hypothetical protein